MGRRVERGWSEVDGAVLEGVSVVRPKADSLRLSRRHHEHGEATSMHALGYQI